VRKLFFTFFKIAIAVVGIWYVVKGVTWNDSVTIAANGPAISTLTLTRDTPVTLLSRTDDRGRSIFHVRFPSTPVEVRTEVDGAERVFKIPFDDTAVIPGTSEQLHLSREMDIDAGRLKEIQRGQYVHEGLRSLLARASRNWYLVFLAWVLLGIPFFVTAIRWRNLMRPQGIDMPLGKCLQLTFVGQFYSIILPGITGGDLVKIVYAARLTGSKTKSFITIILDRVIGLIALMAIAGTSAGVQLLMDIRHPPAGGVDESHKTLLNVFILIVVLLACLAAGTTVYFSRRLRKLIGIEWFIENFGVLSDTSEGTQQIEHERLEHLFRVLNTLALLLAALGIAGLATLRWGLQSAWAVHNTPVIYIAIWALAIAAGAAAAALVLHRRLVDRATPLMGKVVQAIIGVDQTLHVYRGHFGLLGWAFVISVISQLTLPLSAWLCGMAFGMTAPPTHYLAYVPLAILAASLPISPPSGAGVLESVLNQFFVNRGNDTASQAFALAQSVRFLPILWNLVGGYWVVTGKYSRKTDSEG
jgi:uncharacterized membrane protein YbhN (UPF0104 family)